MREDTVEELTTDILVAGGGVAGLRTAFILGFNFLSDVEFFIIVIIHELKE